MGGRTFKPLLTKERYTYHTIPIFETRNDTVK